MNLLKHFEDFKKPPGSNQITRFLLIIFLIKKFLFLFFKIVINSKHSFHGFVIKMRKNY